MAIKIKGWDKFQHFKDRRPPWIKLYRDLLDDKVWHDTNAESCKMLVMLWLIASENEGILPPSSELAFRLRTTVKSINSSISKLSHWLIQDDIEVISDINEISTGYQETRLETETETEKRQSKRESELSLLLDIGVDEQVGKDWLQVRKAKRAPLTKTALKELQREAVNAGIPDEQAIYICIKKNWQNFNSKWNWKDVDYFSQGESKKAWE